jgi:hypothetical protein
MITEVPPEKESYVVKIDPSNGEPLGKYPVRCHELNIAADGTLLPATPSSQLLLLAPGSKAALQSYFPTLDRGFSLKFSGAPCAD